jgi:hypothetical protein
LQETIQEEMPDLEMRSYDDGATLHVAAPGDLDDPDGARVILHADGSDLLVEGVWRIRVGDSPDAKLRAFILDYVRDAIKNHGWQVPILLRGGPRNGQRLSQEREHLVGRLIIDRKPRRKGGPRLVDLYKWHLRRNDDGEYVCYFEQTLGEKEIESFFARGVEKTGPFSVISDAG